MTTERYWNADEPPDEILDWVSDNVVSAIKEYWEFLPVAVAELRDGHFVLTIEGPGKPTDEDPTGQHDTYSATYDLLRALQAYSDQPGEERAAALRKLADDVATIATKSSPVPEAGR
jgi:hypothetical protein